MEYTLTQLAEALETAGRVEMYLISTTYQSYRGSGYGPPYTWGDWWSNTNKAVDMVSAGQDEVRHQIAKRIGAKLLY